MRFTLRPEAIERLDLSPDLKEREFEGPSLEVGILGGFTFGECQWACKQINVPGTDSMDQVGVQLLYYFLSIRRGDPQAIPAKRFRDLMNIDFEIVRHTPEGDPLEGCIQCGRAWEASLHQTPDE
jgi:hypothetical protein